VLLNNRKGIYCKSLEHLKNKICLKFNLPEIAEKNLKLFTEDGTEIDDEDYFSTIEPQSFLIATFESMKLKKNQSDENVFDHLLTMIRWSGGVESVSNQVKEVIGENFEEKWRQMAAHVKNKEITTSASTIEEDPDWFEGLSTNAKTKESFMLKNCQSRIRGYLAKSESQLKEWNDLDSDQKEVTDSIIKSFKEKSKQNEYHGSYFNRLASKNLRICDDFGTFLCEGKYDQEKCEYFGEEIHSINPYQSNESRILFSTWNLDHVIERSRSVVPSIVRAVKDMKRRNIDIDYFYNLLFTRINLKLVHIVCHDKQEHTSMKCNPSLFYLKKN